MEPTSDQKAKKGDSRKTWQSKKRELNREQILEAALAAFSSRSYSSVTVEDIVEKACISRATFYKHFANKVAICIALSQEKVSPLADNAYENLAEMSDPTIRQLVNWVRKYLSIFEQNRIIIETLAEVWIVEPEYHKIMVDKHELNFRMLGRTIPAFHCAASGLDKHKAIRIRAHFLMRTLEEFCNAVVVHNWAIDKETGIRVIAEEINRFIQDGKNA